MPVYDVVMVQTGELAPPITAIDLTGTPQTLASLTGPRGLILLFYRGYW